MASLPGAVRALLAGKLHSRVPATILIAIGAFVATLGDTLNRFGMTEWFQLGKFLGVLFLFAGFLVSIEVFHEIRVPFTSIRIGRTRHEPAGAEQLAAAGHSETAGEHPTPEHAPKLTGRGRYHATADGPTMAPMPAPSAQDRSGRPSPGSRSSSWPRRCSGCSGRCRASPTTPGWSRSPFVAWRGAIGLDRDGRLRRVADLGAAASSLTRLGDLDRGARVSLAVAALWASPSTWPCSSRSTS